MISHEHRCIFVHIPKTGGTSVEDLIWGPDRESRTVDELWMGTDASGANPYQTGGLQHLLAGQVREAVGAPVFEEYFSFSFVRNPWDRAVSQYVYMRCRPRLRELVGMHEDDSFREYLRKTGEVSHVQWEPQWRFLCDEEGHSLVDFVGRFETLERDVAYVVERLGIERGALPHELRGERGPYRDYYDDETRDIVAARYRRHVELFGYRFQ